MTDGELAQAVQTGRHEVFTTLVERHQSRIYRLCRHVCGNADDAEDLAHEAFVEAFLKIGGLREPERFGAWLRALALNLCRMWYRRNRRIAALPACEPTNEPVEEAADYAPVYAGMARLSADHRLALVLHYWEGLSYEETACFLDVPVGTVMSRLHRARRLLRRHLERWKEEETVMTTEGDIRHEVEAEIRLLLQMMAQGQPEVVERLDVLLRRTPERFAMLVREAEDAQTREDLALLLRRLGAPGVEAALAGAYSTDAVLRDRARCVLKLFVARSRPGSEGQPSARLAARGLYRLADRLIACPVDAGEKVGLTLDLLDATGKDDRAALLLLNLLLCWPEAAMPHLLDRFRQAASPEALFRPADALHALCRTGTRFARALLAPLRENVAPGRSVALAGAEALARTLCHNPGWQERGWLDLASVPDEEVALDARLRRKWAVPLRRDRDSAVLRSLAEAVAPLASGGDAGTRNRAVRTLGMLRARAFLEPVMAAAQDADPTLRRAALRALADLADPRATALLSTAVRSTQPGERKLAVEALGLLRDAGSLPLITGMLDDPDREVRRAAVAALRLFGEEEALNAIRRASHSPDRAVQEMATRAMFAAHKARAAENEPRSFRMAEVVREGAKPPLYHSLEAAMRALPEDRAYDEKEVTRLIGQVCIDYSSVRRYLVEEGVLRRERGVYTLTETGRAVWRVERFLRERYMA